MDCDQLPQFHDARVRVVEVGRNTVRRLWDAGVEIRLSGSKYKTLRLTKGYISHIDPFLSASP